VGASLLAMPARDGLHR